MTRDALERAADKIDRLCRRPDDVVSLWRSTTEVLAQVVPHWWTPCWYTMDPASLLVTSHFHEGLDEFPQEWLVSEYYDDDVNQMVDVARSKDGISTLHEATDGQPQRSPRWHRNMTMGGDQELVARLRNRSGDVWGVLALYRAPGAPSFSDGDKAFIRSVSPALADGVRRALLIGQAREPDLADSPGLLVLDGRCGVESATPEAARYLADLPGGDGDLRRLPSAIVALAARAQRMASASHRDGDVAVSRVLTRSGTWMVLHGTLLTSSGEPRIAVIIEPAQPARIYTLMMSVYGLTNRERDVTRLVLRGASTNQIAVELAMSAHTVQQHLKNIFDKTGVRSRRDLVGKIFFAHYEPRFRDNEERALSDQPLRGGPWQAHPSSAEPGG